MKLRCGIIGSGKVARDMHIPNLVQNKMVAIVSICDSNDYQLNKSKELLPKSIETYDNYLDMFDTEHLDFVNICTPGFSHFEIAKQALANGVNVLAEKPLALHLNEIFELKELSKNKDLLLGIMMNYRYKDIVLSLKNQIDNRYIGQIRKMHTFHHGPCVYNESQWLWDEKKSYSLIYESGIHFIDLQVFINGPHERIKYLQPVYDEKLKLTTEIQAIIEYKNGAEGYIDLAQTSLGHSSFNSWINVYGTAQDAFLRWFPPRISFESGFHDPLKQFSDEYKVLSSLTRKLIFKNFQKYRQESHKRVIDLFINSLATGSPFPIDIDSILPTMILIEEIKSKIPSYNQ